MGIVVSQALALSKAFAETANTPIIGYQNLASESNISATTEAADHPASNLANPSTLLRWEGVPESPAQDDYITIEIESVEPLDYLAIARHNFGSAGIAVSVEGLLDPDESPEDWIELVQPALLADDKPTVFRFEPQALAAIRLRMQPGTAAPTLAVLYTGALLKLQRNIYVGHTPITYGRQSRITNARSESGNFLGRIVLSERTETSVNLQNLTPLWFRANMVPFIEAAVERPFFFAWRPGSYPREVGFCWLTNDPRPSNQRPNGMMAVELEMAGIVK